MSCLQILLQYNIISNMKCVLDTDVLVAALRSTTGASREILYMVGRRELTVLASVPLMIEYEAVLKRPEHLQAANLTSQQIDTLIDTLVSLFVPVTPYFLWRPQMRDPNDEMVLEAAVNGQANAIVTFNTRHFRLAASRFGIKTLKPGEFLKGLPIWQM
jgi:putative PIN family toxin of toxin-antitoxin system